MKKTIERITWKSNDFSHSYVKALHTALSTFDDSLTPAEIAVRTGMAFRTIAHRELCPSAMSVLDWSLLEKGAINCGYNVKCVTRLWHEDHMEVERREEAAKIITEAIDNQIPTVTWDVGVPEWELVIGYDDQSETYEGLSVTGDQVQLPYSKLGRREIPILFVLAPQSKNDITIEESLKTALGWAVDHADAKEFCERPDYEDGPRAYETWSKAMNMVTDDDWNSRYYLETYTCMKGYAAEYLESLIPDHPEMEAIATLYKQIHQTLKQALDLRNDKEFPEKPLVDGIKKLILEAGKLEKQAIDAIISI